MHWYWWNHNVVVVSGKEGKVKQSRQSRGEATFNHIPTLIRTLPHWNKSARDHKNVVKSTEEKRAIQRQNTYVIQRVQDIQTRLKKPSLILASDSILDNRHLKFDGMRKAYFAPISFEPKLPMNVASLPLSDIRTSQAFNKY